MPSAFSFESFSCSIICLRKKKTGRCMMFCHQFSLPQIYGCLLGISNIWSKDLTTVLRFFGEGVSHLPRLLRFAPARLLHRCPGRGMERSPCKAGRFFTGGVSNHCRPERMPFFRWKSIFEPSWHCHRRHLFHSRPQGQEKPSKPKRVSSGRLMANRVRDWTRERLLQWF